MKLVAHIREAGMKKFLNSKIGTAFELLLASPFLFGPILFITNTIPAFAIAYASCQIRGKTWQSLGWVSAHFKTRMVVFGIAVGAAYFVVEIYLLEPFATTMIGDTPDISDVKKIVAGNFGGYIIFLILAWSLAAFLEEIVGRGYLLNRLVDLMGPSTIPIFFAVLISSIAFGIMHSDQGIAGGVLAFIFAATMCLLYFKTNRSLIAPIMAHGMFDTLALTLIYLEIDPNPSNTFFGI